MDESRPRLLIFEGQTAHLPGVTDALGALFSIETFDRMDEALQALRHNASYAAVLADAGDFLPLERALVGDQASLVLNTIGEGVCVIDASGACRWSNKQMRSFAPAVFERVKSMCCQARSILAAQIQSQGASHNRSKKFSFQSDDDRYFELIASPVLDNQNQVRQVVAVVWDATSGRRLQQKIDAIDAAGREVTRLDTDQITKLAPDERLVLLRDKIIRYSRDLMHFDHFAIRVLDTRTNKLEVVIAEGMPREAIELDLYAHPEGSGISGYVAARGRSYICHDTEKDPRYVLGIDHSKSSLTVPLLLHDKVIGIFNIESQTVGSFNEDDRQFAEIFGRYVALALKVLELLVVERSTTSGKITDSVVQEVAAPLNDICTDAQTLMEEYIGDDTMRQRLNKIVDNAQTIRSTVREVADGPRTVLGSANAQVADADPLLIGKRILIADDELNIRTAIADLLGKHGCICTVCKDGYEAINRIEQEGFDLVLTDIKMPHRNGYEIFACAKRHGRDLPVLLMTGFGYDPNHSIVRASREGLSGVLFKPFKVDQLVDEIKKGLQTTECDGTPQAAPAQDERKM